ncbi:MAG TPA: RibD family protein, partial [Stellaceae bacterium]|nr:RibD family protein [Stellaceae bacterium]
MSGVKQQTSNEDALYEPLLRLPRGRPFALAHLAQSLDGRIATIAGRSRWVSGEEDLDHTHRLRALADAVLVGAGTIRHDDPQLTVRRCPGQNPTRVILDPDQSLTSDYRVFSDGAAPTLVLVAAEHAPRKWGKAELLPLPRGAQGFDPKKVRAVLAERGLNFLFIEGGGVTVSR